VNYSYDTWSNGRHIHTFGVGGRLGLSISREALQQSFASGVKAGTVQLSKTLVAAEESDDGVTLTMSDGHTEKYDLVVGADGCHSAVSKCLFPDDPGLEFTGEYSQLAIC